MESQSAVHDDHDHWLRRNRWRIGLALAAVVGGYWWHRASRRRRIDVDGVSREWLAEREFDAGQHPGE
jgi:hypothetical protein